jgi:hypothetical protein
VVVDELGQPVPGAFVVSDDGVFPGGQRRSYLSHRRDAPYGAPPRNVPDSGASLFDAIASNNDLGENNWRCAAREDREKQVVRNGAKQS